MISRWLSLSCLVAILLGFTSVTSQAHPGHYHPEQDVDEFEQESFVTAVKHPFTGLDHLLAAVAAGSLAFAAGRKRGFGLAGGFIGAMAVGYLVGRSGFTLPMLEQGLALSVLAGGILLMMTQRASLVMQLGVLGVIGFWNGNAHGLEAPHAMFGLGLCVGSALLVIAGAGAAKALTMLSPQATRYAGATMAITGLALCAMRLA